jgi:two-component system KDP operon response regulator KdpE
MTRVLVVDDDAPIQRALVANLRARGYETAVAGSGEEALLLVARRCPDVVILDLGLPGMPGTEVIEGLRGWTTVPIIVLSARGSERDKVSALDAGADDYVTKPFGMDELFARLRAAVRRRTPMPERAVITTPDFTVDLNAKRILRDGAEVRLTPTEWGIVEVLVTNADKLVPPGQLLQDVWGPGYERATNYLRVHLAHIRRKLEPEQRRPRYFLTEAGMGYRFRPPEAS